MEVEWTPGVSVVIPVRNGAAGIERAAASALDQSYAGFLEVVIAMAPSSDETAEIADRLATDHRVRVVPNPTGRTAAGLNAAIAVATGDVIVRCDAFAALPAGYVSKAVTVLHETGAANVGGLQAAVGTTFFERAVALAVTSPLGAGDARYRIGGVAGSVDTVYLGVFRRAALESVGGFDERFIRSQDAELNLRLARAGETVWFDPALRVEYRPRGSFVALWRQYFGYGWWRRQVARVHRRTLRMRQLIPPLFVVSLVASAALWPIAPTVAAVLPGLYAIAVAAATVRGLVRSRDLAALLLPMVLPTIHLAWGIGFLASYRAIKPE